MVCVEDTGCTGCGKGKAVLLGIWGGNGGPRNHQLGCCVGIEGGGRGNTIFPQRPGTEKGTLNKVMSIVDLEVSDVDLGEQLNPCSLGIIREVHIAHLCFCASRFLEKT